MLFYIVGAAILAIIVTRITLNLRRRKSAPQYFPMEIVYCLNGQPLFTEVTSANELQKSGGSLERLMTKLEEQGLKATGPAWQEPLITFGVKTGAILTVPVLYRGRSGTFSATIQAKSDDPA